MSNTTSTASPGTPPDAEHKAVPVDGGGDLAAMKRQAEARVAFLENEIKTHTDVKARAQAKINTAKAELRDARRVANSFTPPKRAGKSG